MGIFYYSIRVRTIIKMEICRGGARGRMPAEFDSPPSPRRRRVSVATRPTDEHSAGRKPGAGRGSGLTPLVGNVSASSRCSSGSIFFDNQQGSRAHCVHA